MSPGGATAAGTRAAVLQDPFAVSGSKPVVKISSMPTDTKRKILFL